MEMRVSKYGQVGLRQFYFPHTLCTSLPMKSEEEEEEKEEEEEV